jgi:hypothetical protein
LVRHGDYPYERTLNGIDQREGKCAKDGAAKWPRYANANFGLFTKEILQPFKFDNESAAKTGNSRLIALRCFNELQICFGMESSISMLEACPRPADDLVSRNRLHLARAQLFVALLRFRQPSRFDFFIRRSVEVCH